MFLQRIKYVEPKKYCRQKIFEIIQFISGQTKHFENVSNNFQLSYVYDVIIEIYELKPKNFNGRYYF